MSKKIITLCTIVLTTFVLTNIGQSCTTFADQHTKHLQILQTQEALVPDSVLRLALNKELGQPENANITEKQLNSLDSDLYSLFGVEGITSLEGLQYCNSLKSVNISFYGTFTDLSPLSSWKNRVEFGLLNEINSEVNKSMNISSDNSLSVYNPYKDENGNALVPKNISDDGIYDDSTNKIIWKNLDSTKDHTLTADFDRIINGANSTELSMTGELRIDAIASNSKIIEISDQNLKSSLIKHLNEQQIEGISSRQVTDPIYENELEKLTKLDLSNQEVKNLSPLVYCTDLTTLNLANTSLSDSALTAIMDLPKLHTLDLSKNKLEDISSLARGKCTQSLQTLIINNNDIKTIDRDMLTSMPQLQVFEASYNFLTNFNFVLNWYKSLESKIHIQWDDYYINLSNQNFGVISAKIDSNHEVRIKNPLDQNLTQFTLSNHGVYDKENNTFIWGGVKDGQTLSVFAAVKGLSVLSYDISGSLEVTVTQTKPAEWGLSVPTTVKLDKEYLDSSKLTMCGNAKLEIVNEDGSTFKNDQKNHTFEITGSGAYKVSSGFISNGNVLKDKDGNVLSNTIDGFSPTPVFLEFAYANQGEAEPKNLLESPGFTDDALKTTIESKTDNSIAPHKWLQFSINFSSKQKIEKNASTTIRWTATEKTS